MCSGEWIGASAGDVVGVEGGGEVKGFDCTREVGDPDIPKGRS